MASQYHRDPPALVTGTTQPFLIPASGGIFGGIFASYYARSKDFGEPNRFSESEASVAGAKHFRGRDDVVVMGAGLSP